MKKVGSGTDGDVQCLNILIFDIYHLKYQPLSILFPNIKNNPFFGAEKASLLLSNVGVGFSPLFASI